MRQQVRHFIIISSLYSQGKRMARHYIFPDEYERAEKDLATIKQKCGTDAPISTHFVETYSESWRSVQEKDSFFKNVVVIEKLDRFIKLLKGERVLKGIDIAYYILSKRRFGHVKLEKLVYFCYADYLCSHNEPLFDDLIFAYDKGPVVSSVYQKFHKHNGALSGKYDYMSIRSKILFAYEGVDKLRSIEDTLEKYMKFRPDELIQITHKKGTPWDITDKRGRNARISDDDIIKAHYVESEEL